MTMHKHGYLGPVSLKGFVQATLNFTIVDVVLALLSVLTTTVLGVSAAMGGIIEKEEGIGYHKAKAAELEGKMAKARGISFVFFKTVSSSFVFFSLIFFSFVDATSKSKLRLKHEVSVLLLHGGATPAKGVAGINAPVVVSGFSFLRGFDEGTFGSVLGFLGLWGLFIPSPVLWWCCLAIFLLFITFGGGWWIQQ
ncbi:uncharacterized protein G2W53_018642 [Senna tora]|uniref:Uncharacterized protein n=1 Tax=Senna tora TaxID=362788 RepID=A0A834WNI7_9FABA|nr:uncharacterized protein G2W53_018642 [Senna tora]